MIRRVELSLQIGCDAVIFALTGSDYCNVNETRLPLYVARTPAGTSVQDMIHWTQGVRSGKFQKYDFGSKGEYGDQNDSVRLLYALHYIWSTVLLAICFV